MTLYKKYTYEMVVGYLPSLVLGIRISSCVSEETLICSILCLAVLLNLVYATEPATS